jgi:hypothetical protein
MTVSGSHQPVRASFSPRLTTTPWRFGDSEVMVKQPPPGHLFGSPVSAFGCPNGVRSPEEDFRGVGALHLYGYAVYRQLDFPARHDFADHAQECGPFEEPASLLPARTFG